MNLSDVADSIVIDPRKLTRYALDPDSPYGKHKAIIFERVLGINLDNYEMLLGQIESEIGQAQFTFLSEDQFGDRYYADLQISGTLDKQAMIRTGWFIRSGTRIAQLVTLYVIKR